MKYELKKHPVWDRPVTLFSRRFFRTGKGKKSPHWFHSKVWSYLHIRVCHSPRQVEVRWKRAYKRFEKRHYGSSVRGHMSRRFANKYTAHSYN